MSKGFRFYFADGVRIDVVGNDDEPIDSLLYRARVRLELLKGIDWYRTVGQSGKCFAYHSIHIQYRDLMEPPQD